MSRLLTKLIDRNFIENPRPFILQSLIGIAFVVLILYFLTTMTHAAIVAALGSSTFITFAMPHFPTARARRVVGGHTIGILCGLASFYLFVAGPFAGAPQRFEWLVLVSAGLSIGLSVFLMPIFNAEHPPAAGTALGFAVSGWHLQAVVFVVAYAIALSLTRFLLRQELRDLV